MMLLKQLVKKMSAKDLQGALMILCFILQTISKGKALMTLEIVPTTGTEKEVIERKS